MSLREEQCNKVCKILDNVLANRPTERDSLIVAVRKAFKALEEPHWIPVTICPNEDEDYICTLEDSNGNFTNIVSHDGVQGWGFYPDDGDDFLPVANVIAWMPLPEPYKGVTE